MFLEDVSNLFTIILCDKSAAQLGTLIGKERKSVYSLRSGKGFLLNHDFLTGLNRMGYDIKLVKLDTGEVYKPPYFDPSVTLKGKRSRGKPVDPQTLNPIPWEDEAPAPTSDQDNATMEREITAAHLNPDTIKQDHGSYYKTLLAMCTWTK